MIIQFTQYLLPDGRKEPIEIDVAEPVGKAAEALIKVGAHFDAEILTTGEVSLTCDMDLNGETENLAIQVIPNGPQVPKAVVVLVKEAVAEFKRRTDAKNTDDIQAPAKGQAGNPGPGP